MHEVGKLVLCFDAIALHAERNPPIEEVIKSGVVPKFVEFLQRGDAPQLQVRSSDEGAMQHADTNMTARLTKLTICACAFRLSSLRLHGRSRMSHLAHQTTPRL